MRPGGYLYVYLVDGLGSVAALTDSAGNVANRYTYDPYGTVTSASGSVANPWRFGGAYGAYTDAATGLVKIGQRYYDPAVGRWTQPDPKVMPFDVRQANRYAYAGCDPVNNVDPSGTSCLTAALGLAGVTLFFDFNVATFNGVGAVGMGLIVPGAVEGFFAQCDFPDEPAPDVPPWITYPQGA